MTLVWLGHQAQEVQRVNREHKASQENLVFQVQQVLQAQWVIWDIRVPRVKQDLPVLQVYQVSRGHQVIRAIQDFKGHQVEGVKMVSLEQEDQQVQ